MSKLVAGLRADRLRVAIIGGGMAGIAMAERLMRAGFDDFEVFEQSPSLGGTWHDARYPGAAVDTAQPMYSYSFTRTHSFGRLYAKQGELLEYLEQTVDELGLRRHFRFNSRVSSVVWDEVESAYHVAVDGHKPETFQIVVSAVGLLNNPRYPDWPHLDQFTGAAFHSARWETIDLAGKRVALVGTGSAAAQIVGAIAPEVAQLYVFQREPGWVIPKGDREFTPAERTRLAKPRERSKLRARQFLATELGSFRGGRGILQKPGSPANLKSQKVAEDYIADVFADRPDLARLVTPTYAYGGKRVVKDSTYYPALLRDNVSLIPNAVVDAYERGVVDAVGERYDVDVIIMATGYQASNYLGTYDVVGRAGKTLKDYWNGEPSAFMGVTVPGFPNFFIMYGPNTNSVHLAYLFECQASYIESCRRRIVAGAKRLEVRPRWHARYNDLIQRRLSRTSTAAAVRSGVHNYYASPSGRIVASLPISNLMYKILLKALGRLSITAK